jgi:hypothetical protein
MHIANILTDSNTICFFLKTRKKKSKIEPFLLVQSLYNSIEKHLSIIWDIRKKL